MNRSFTRILVMALSLAAVPAAHAEEIRISQVAVPDYRSIAATVTTRDTGEVRARIPGTLTSLKVREGDVVKAGQVLAVVSDQKVAIEEQGRIAQAAALKAESDRAAADLARVRQLFEKGFYSQAKLDQAVAGSKAATAAWKAAASATALTTELAQQGKLLAPADGRILRASVPAGAVVMAGDDNAPVSRREGGRQRRQKRGSKSERTAKNSSRPSHMRSTITRVCPSLKKA